MPSPQPLRIGIVGCGNIAEKAYVPACRKFPILDLAAVADLDMERARALAASANVPKACSVDELLADPSIDIVVNLTVPKAHAPVDLAALAAGKHVFSEKPFALTRDEGLSIVHAAAARNLRVGCAPDTVLGAGIQTCRKLIDEGAIGRPVAFTANMLCGGHETWHPSPEFYYEKGGGPMFDMGPYYLHALITLLGPVRRVTGSTRITFPERTITSEPKAGKKVAVEVPTHVVAVLDFVCGATGTLTTSFDIRVPYTYVAMEIYGAEGSIKVPDPNATNGPVFLGKGRDWAEVPHSHPYQEGARGVGVADMAAAIRAGREHRCNERVAMHALDIMQAVHEASGAGRHVELLSTCERPAPMRADLPEGALD